MADNWQLKAVLSANAEGMLKTLKAVNRATRDTRKYLSDVGSSAVNLAGHVGVPLGLISGALSAFSVAGLKQVVTAFAQLGDEVHKSAQRIGVSTDEYQRIKYVAGQTGVATEELGSSMGRLNKGIALAAAGKNKDLAGLFARAGISMRGANGELRSATDLLPELADLFARNGNAATQARMGNAIFGKSWQALAPLLQGGKVGIDELNERYKMLGISVEENAIIAGEKFGDQMDDLRQVTASYGNTITSKLLPVLSPLLEKTIAWAVANRDLITSRVSAFVSEMADSLAKVDWSGVIKGVGDFIGGVKDFITWIGGARNALIGLVFIMNVQTLMAVASLIGALGRAGLAFALMAAKAYLAGNAGLLAMLRVAAVALFTAGPLGVLGAAFAWMGGMAAGAGGLLSGAMGLAAKAVRGLGVALMANPLGVLLGIATAAYLIYENWDTLKGWFVSFFDWISGKFEMFLGWAKDLAGMVGLFGGGSGAAGSPGSSGAAGSPSLVTSSQARVGGEINVRFADAPPGMRVEQASAGPVAINSDVGYRGFAMGMP